MARDFRPNELETQHTSVTSHRLVITHKASGVRVAGTGDNKYALECKLLDILRVKLADHERKRQEEETPTCLR